MLEVINGNTESDLCNQAYRRWGEVKKKKEIWLITKAYRCEKYWSVWDTALSWVNINPWYYLARFGWRRLCLQLWFDRRGCLASLQLFHSLTSAHSTSSPAVNVEILHFTFFGCPMFLKIVQMFRIMQQTTHTLLVEPAVSSECCNCNPS